MNLKTSFAYIALSLLIALSAALYGCNSAGEVNSNLQITSLVAEHPAIYPLGNTRINCTAMSRDGSLLNYTWSCTDGKIIGSGTQITWEAPRTYGDFHIMAMVDDGKGNSINKVVTVTVIVRDPSACCR